MRDPVSRPARPVRPSLSAMALAAMQGSLAAPVPVADDQRPRGCTPIWSDGEWSLDLSPRGYRYGLCRLDQFGVWRTEMVAMDARQMRSAIVADRDDLPPALWAAIMALPDDPTTYRPASASVTGD